MVTEDALTMLYDVRFNGVDVAVMGDALVAELGTAVCAELWQEAKSGSIVWMYAEFGEWPTAADYEGRS